MTDIITLGIRIDPSGVVTGVSVGEREFNRLANAADRTVKKVSAIDQGFGALKRQILAFASIGTALKVFHDLTQNTIQAETSQKRLEGTLRATQHAAGLTAREIGELADELQRTSLVDDEKVKDASAVLASFRRVQGDTFTEGIRLANDLAFVMGGDLVGAALQVGKALNDPVQGIGALRRAGVQLNDEQERMVKQFIKANDVASAQKIIIGELRNEFGGAAAGAHSGLTGAVHSLTVEYSELLETIGKGNTGGFLGGLAERAARVLASLRRSIDESPEGKQVRLAADIDREQRALEASRRGGGSAATIAEREARIRALTIEYNAQAMALATLNAAERDRARAQGEVARDEQVRSDRAAAVSEAREEAEKKIKEITDGLRDEAATLGQSAGQARIYELRMLGASQATIAMAEAHAELADAFNSFDLSKLPDFTQQIDDFLSGKGMKGRQPGDEHLTSNQRTLRDLRNQAAYGTTDLDAVRDIQVANGMNPEGQAGAAYDALAEKNKQTAEYFETIWKRAAENSQDALADFLANVGTDLGSAEDLFRNFVKAVVRMLAEIAAARILGGGADGAGGGWFGKLLKGLVGGAAGSGLPSAPGVGDIGDSLGGVPMRFHRGGQVGLRPGEIPIIAERGEGILSKEQMAQLGGGGGGMVLNVAYSPNVQALDQRGVEEVLQRHAATIAGISMQAMSESAAFRRGMRGRR